MAPSLQLTGEHTGQQPIQLSDNKWYIPGKETIIGFGDVVMEESKAKVTPMPEKLWSPPDGAQSALGWLNSQVDEVCALSRQV